MEEPFMTKTNASSNDTMYGCYLRIKDYRSRLMDHLKAKPYGVTNEERDRIKEEVFRVEMWLKDLKKDFTIEFVSVEE